MNEKLKELKNRAFEMTEWEELDYDVILERFGELIVRECIANVKDWEKDSRNHISYMLERHFGVEE